MAPYLEKLYGKLVELLLELLLLCEIDNVLNHQLLLLPDVFFPLQNFVKPGLKSKLAGPQFQFGLEVRLIWG